MKRIVLLLALALLSAGLYAQNVVLTLSPNPAEANDVIDMNDPNFELVAYATLTNVSSSPVSVRWNRVAPSLPMGWEVAVCDVNQCYLPLVFSNYMPDIELDIPVELDPGETSNLDVHIYPNQFPGSTTVTVELTVNGDTAVVVTGTYNFSASLTSSFNGPAARQDVRVYPNPTTDFFQLSNGSGVGRVIVYNTLGRQVRTYDAYDGRRYSLAGLPDGMYLVRLKDNQSNVMKTVRVIKRGIRP